MSIENLYERYVANYEMDKSTLEHLSLEEFKEKLKDNNFNNKWGHNTNHSSDFMYNWIRSKSGR